MVAGSNSAEDRPITRTPDLDARFQATSPSTSRNATAYAICTLLVLKDIINPSKEALHDLYEFIGFSNRTFHGSSVSDEKKFFELESIPEVAQWTHSCGDAVRTTSISVGNGPKKCVSPAAQVGAAKDQGSAEHRERTGPSKDLLV